MEAKAVVSKGEKVEMMTLDMLNDALQYVARALKTLDVTHNPQSVHIRNAFITFYQDCHKYHKYYAKTVEKLQDLLKFLKATKKGTKATDKACEVVTVVLLVGGVLSYATPLGPFVAIGQVIGALSTVASLTSALVKFGIDEKTTADVLKLLEKGKKTKEPLDKSFGALQKTLFEVIDDIMSKSPMGIKNDETLAKSVKQLREKLASLQKKDHKGMILKVDKMVQEDSGAKVIFGTHASKTVVVRSTVAMIKGSKVLGRAIVPVGVIYDSYSLFDSATKKSETKDELCVAIEAIIYGMEKEKASFDKLIKCQQYFFDAKK